MKLHTSLAGTVRAKLTGADIPGTLDQLSRQGVEILGFTMLSELEGRITLRRTDYASAKKLCDCRGDSLTEEGRNGLYWTFKSLRKRPVLVFGVLFYLISTLYLPSRVFFVRVVGNETLPDRLILEAASDCGIGFGASRREVRSEKVKNALLEALPDLQWAGVNTYGCVAEISVRERITPEVGSAPSDFGHIVASREGVITSCNATRGTLLCTPGQAVTQGDILISGYTDCGLTIRAEQAHGEVFAATVHNLTAVTPDSCHFAAPTGTQKKKISIIIGKKRINLWKDSGIWDTTCDRMYEEYYITLPGGFRLPVALAVERFSFRACSETEIPHDELEVLLTETAQRYLKSQMLAGVIRNAEETFQRRSGTVQMAGKYDCVELIGVMQRLQIGEQNGEDN